MTDAVAIIGLGFAYPRCPPLFEGVELRLSAGTMTAVVGPNAVGKSTLLKLVAGLVRPQQGSVRVFGHDPSRLRGAERARLSAWLAQRESEDAPFTALELVLMGRFAFQGLLPFDRAVDVAAARSALEQVDALELASRRLDELSGGELQRVHLARALAQEPRLLLLDEPAAALDLRHQVATYRRLSELRRRGLTIVVVSHDLNLPADHVDRAVVLAEGRVHASGPPDQVLRAHVLEDVYRTRILEARVEGRAAPVLLPAGGGLSAAPELTRPSGT